MKCFVFFCYQEKSIYLVGVRFILGIKPPYTVPYSPICVKKYKSEVRGLVVVSYKALEDFDWSTDQPGGGP